MDEANNLKQALQTGGFTLIGVDINGWTGLSGLEHVLDSIETVAVDCCLLFVCLMSHGGRGFLEPSKGNKIPVNDILHKLQDKLPPPIPMVCFMFRKPRYFLPYYSFKLVRSLFIYVDMI